MLNVEEELEVEREQAYEKETVPRHSLASLRCTREPPTQPNLIFLSYAGQQEEREAREARANGDEDTVGLAGKGRQGQRGNQLGWPK
jgi:hypothetical protein